MAFEVDWKEAHPLFRTSGPQSHDLAIIKLKPKGDGGAGFGVKMSAAVSPICIPEPGDLFKDDLPCVVSGWGQILRKYQKHALKKGWPLHGQVLCNFLSSWDEIFMPFLWKMSCVTESLGLGRIDNLRTRWYTYKPWPWPENMNKHKYPPKTKTKVSHRGKVCLHSAQCVLQITNQHKSFANPITSSHHQIQTPSAKKKVRGECLRAAKVPLINQAACSRMYRWKYYFLANPCDDLKS